MNIFFFLVDYYFVLVLLNRVETFEIHCELYLKHFLKAFSFQKYMQ